MEGRMRNYEERKGQGSKIGWKGREKIIRRERKKTIVVA